MSGGRSTAVSAGSRVLEAAGEQVASELARSAAVDLRDDIAAVLRADGPSARSTPAVGCPCGCGESELLQRARDGDDGALTELLERYRVMARSKARTFFVLGADRDDVVQEGMIGVYKAIRDFRPDGGATFRTFAEVCVTRQIISAVKAAGRQKHAPLTTAASLDAPVSADEGATNLADLLPTADSADPAALVVSAEQLRALQCHFDQVLSDLEAQVLRHHLDGRSYEEIAAMLQRHVKSIDNALQRIKRKVQDHLDAQLADG